MKTWSRVFAPALAVLLMLSFPLQAQVFPRGNGIALTGKNQFDLYVQVNDWRDMQQDMDSFRLATLRQFEQTLQDEGIRRRPANRNYLVCAVQATRSGNQVAYSTTVEYWELESTKVNSLQWQQGGINTVVTNRFNEELVASECATRFLAEWVRWNPATDN